MLQDHGSEVWFRNMTLSHAASSATRMSLPTPLSGETCCPDPCCNSHSGPRLLPLNTNSIPPRHHLRSPLRPIKGNCPFAQLNSSLTFAVLRRHGLESGKCSPEKQVSSNLGQNSALLENSLDPAAAKDLGAGVADDGLAGGDAVLGFVEFNAQTIVRQDFCESRTSRAVVANLGITRKRLSMVDQQANLCRRRLAATCEPMILCYPRRRGANRARLRRQNKVRPKRLAVLFVGRS